MPRTMSPTFRELSATEMHELLARNHVGRIAYSFHDRVDIEPISYVFADDAFYMRTEPGSKLATLAHAPWAAFEVDEIRGPFDWRSVVACSRTLGPRRPVRLTGRRWPAFARSCQRP
jgi:nitroimidazol reductase NimA-like FMN-containing flavoprotein (pyridoxamine 5'-phosphate oxidase superfamily)